MLNEVGQRKSNKLKKGHFFHASSKKIIHFHNLFIEIFTSKLKLTFTKSDSLLLKALIT